MENRTTVLIVDDVETIRLVLRVIMKREGMEVIEAHDGQTALDWIQRGKADVMLLDVRMPGMDGHEVLRRARLIDNDLPVIMITAFAGVSDAVHAVRAGAYDYLAKPFSNEEVLLTIHNALRDRRRKSRVGRPDSESEGPSLQDEMGHSPAIQALAAELKRVAPTDFSILIVGETGVGKEVVARAIHRQSPRAAHKLVAVDCGAIPDTLIESEFFGHEKGAFTGADQTTLGKFETAAGGTLFLDEMSNLPLAMQGKLLRTLQEKCFYRVGGCTPIQAEARILAATNQDLSRAGAAEFRSDLYHRLSEFVFRVQTLRERKADIAFLAKRFVERTNRELGKQVAGFTDGALDILRHRNWPGNVRELRNIVRRAVLLAEDVIGPEHLGPLKPALVETPTAGSGEPAERVGQSLKEISKQCRTAVERSILTEVMERVGGNKAMAARVLQVDYKTIHAKIKEYGL